MGSAIAILIGLSAGLAAPSALIFLFYKSYSLERKRIEQGGIAVFQKSRAFHPENELTQRAIDLGVSVKIEKEIDEVIEDRNFYIPPML